MTCRKKSYYDFILRGCPLCGFLAAYSGELTFKANIQNGKFQ